MTKQEWQECDEPDSMLKLLQGKASNRKLRLFSVACLLRHQNLYRGRNHQLLQALVNFADERISREEMEQARQTWHNFDIPFRLRGTWKRALSLATLPDEDGLMENVREAATDAADDGRRPGRERAIQAVFLRDIFGNPFVKCCIESEWVAWNDGIIPRLAKGIYDDQAFDRFPGPVRNLVSGRVDWVDSLSILPYGDSQNGR